MKDILWIATKENGFHSLNYYENSIDNYNDFLRNNNDFVLNSFFKLNENEIVVIFDKQTFVLNFIENTFIPFRQHPIARNLKSTFKKDFSTLNHIANVNINGEKWIFLCKPYDDFYFVKNEADFSKSSAFMVKQDYPTKGIVSTVKSDIYNNIWIGTEWGLRILNYQGIDKESRLPYYNNLFHGHNQTAFSLGITDLYLDSNRNMWVSLTNNSTMVFPAIDVDSIPELLRYRIHTPSIEKLIVRQIVQESDSVFLLATFGEGLVRYNFYTDDAEYLTRTANFKSSMVNSVVIDNKGNYWMGTEKGICILNPQKALGENMFYLTENSGLLDNYFVNKCALNINDNKILMGNQSNLAVIDSTVFSKDSFVTQPYISSIELYKRSDKNYKEEFNYYSFIKEDSDGIIYLPHRFYGFKISFSSLSLKNPSNNKYAYRLVGYNNKWTYVNNEENSVFYQNIPEGTYTFQLKVSNSRNEWNNTPLSIPIRIKPVFWKTNLFKTIFIILIALLALYIYFRRNYLLEKRNKSLENQIQSKIKELKSQNEKLEELLTKKNKFISILSHDLKNPLSASKGLIDIIIADIATLNESEMLHYLKSISESLEGTYSLLENLVMWGKKVIASNQQFTPQTFNLHDELEKNIRYFVPNAKNVSIVNNVQKNVVLVGDLNMFDAVVRNLITNALKYSYVNDKVIFSSSVHNRNAVIKITDYGKGIAPEKINDILNPNKVLSTLGTKGEAGTGFGLMIVQDFVALMGGILSVESVEFKGTTFTFTLPLA
jgi:signal transduction histidine kinase